MLRSTALAICAAALLAAVSAHVAIDILGDFLVRDDTYDHVAHGSRVLFTVGALGFAATAGFYLIRRLLTAATSLRTRVRMLHISRAQILCAVTCIALVTLLLVPAMETLDVLRVGGDLDSPADLFGGSLLLGVGTSIGCALGWSVAIFGIAAWLLRHRDRVAQLLFELLSLRRAQLACVHERRAPDARCAKGAVYHARAHGKRGPPRAVLAVPVC